MGKTKLVYLKSALKFDSFDVAIANKIPFSRGRFPLFSKITQIFSGSLLLISKTKLDESYIFKISIKMQFF